MEMNLRYKYHNVINGTNNRSVL